MKSLHTVALSAALSAVLASPALASTAGRPVYLHGGQHSCSYTSPEYMLSDYNMHVYPAPGTTRFTAAWAPGHRAWEDAYWVTGYHDENSHICDRRELPGTHGKYGRSLTLPLTLGSRRLVKASMTAHGSGRLGFDLWFTRSRAEVSPHLMEGDPRTWEVMVMPGNGTVYSDNPGWHRVYLGVLPEHGRAISFSGLNLTRLGRLAGVPRRDYWMAVDAGAETTGGSFTVSRYALHVDGDHPVPVRHRLHHRRMRRHRPRPWRHYPQKHPALHRRWKKPPVRHHHGIPGTRR